LQYKRNKALNEKQQLIIAFPELFCHELQSQDEFILLGCDGIWETLNN